MRDKKTITRKEYAIVLLALADILAGFAAMATKNSYVSLAFAILIFVSGIWMMAATARSSWESSKAKKWPRTPYDVIEAKFAWEMSGGGRPSRFIPYFKIQYSYKGNAYTRSSDDELNLPVNRVFATNHAAQKYLDAVKNHQYGEYVFVNPDAPDIAYLYTGVGRDKIGTLLFSAILIVLPILTWAELIHWR